MADVIVVLGEFLNGFNRGREKVIDRFLGRRQGQVQLPSRR